MKDIRWNHEKGLKLADEREISFEIVASYIERQDIVDIFMHPNQEKYPNQKVFSLLINEYIYLVPFVETETELFLKTIIPSRKANKKYNKGK